MDVSLILPPQLLPLSGFSFLSLSSATPAASCSGDLFLLREGGGWGDRGYRGGAAAAGQAPDYI